MGIIIPPFRTRKRRSWVEVANKLAPMNRAKIEVKKEPKPIAAVVLILGFKLIVTKPAAIQKAHKRAEISPKIFPSPKRPQKTTKIPEVAKKMVTQVLNAKLVRLRQTVKTAAMNGVEAKITSVLATKV